MTENRPLRSYIATPAEAWSDTLKCGATLEGWFLYADGETVSIGVPLVGNSSFGSDAEATSYVIQRALHGSRPHMLAVYLDGRPPAEECWIPDEFVDLVG